jgi:hypothetical protein
VLDTDGPAQPLTELFGDFLYAYQTAGVCLSVLLHEQVLHSGCFRIYSSFPRCARALSFFSSLCTSITEPVTSLLLPVSFMRCPLRSVPAIQQSRLRPDLLTFRPVYVE